MKSEFIRVFIRKLFADSDLIEIYVGFSNDFNRVRETFDMFCYCQFLLFYVNKAETMATFPAVWSGEA